MLAALALTGCGQQNPEPTTTPQANANSQFMAVLEAANKGDYQAQRNLAYGFASSPYPGQEKNPILGCAWYLVVLNSGSPRVDVTDRNNVDVYCGKLDTTALDTAKQRALALLQEINSSSRP
jgi:hypothetical protein